MSLLDRIFAWIGSEVPEADDDIGRSVDRSLAVTAIQMNKAVAALAPPTALTWVILLWARSDHGRLLAWLLLVTTTSVTMLVIACSYSGDERTAQVVTRRLSWALIGAGVGWGALGAIAMPTDESWQALVGMMILATMAVNAIFAASVSRMFWSFQVPVCVVGAVTFTTQSGALGWSIGFILVYALPFSAVLARINRANMQRAAHFAALSQRAADELEAVNLELAHEASHDPLTGIANRQAFARRLESAVSTEAGTVAVLFMDLDRFKRINDEYGHDVGDKALAIAAARIASHIRPSDVLARFGGDEFTVLIEGNVTHDEVGLIAGRILAAFDEPIMIDGRAHQIGISIGIAMTPEPLPATDLLRDADVAMYAAKEAGRGRVRFAGTTA